MFKNSVTQTMWEYIKLHLEHVNDLTPEFANTHHDIREFPEFTYEPAPGHPFDYIIDLFRPFNGFEYYGGNVPKVNIAELLTAAHAYFTLCINRPYDMNIYLPYAIDYGFCAPTIASRHTPYDPATHLSRAAYLDNLNLLPNIRAAVDAADRQQPYELTLIAPNYYRITKEDELNV